MDEDDDWPPFGCIRDRLTGRMTACIPGAYASSSRRSVPRIGARRRLGLPAPCVWSGSSVQRRHAERRSRLLLNRRSSRSCRAKEFWNAIALAKASAGDGEDAPCERQARALEAILRSSHWRTSPPSIGISVRAWMRPMNGGSGVQRPHNGGCSNDGFAFFRGWLIAQGKDIFGARARGSRCAGRCVDSKHDRLWVVVHPVCCTTGI